MGLKIFKQCCKNCLLSNDRIVSSKRAKEIIQECVINQTHFQCHKATLQDKDIMCKSFFDTLGHRSQMVRIAHRLNSLEFVDQVDQEKLPTYKEMSKNKLKLTTSSTSQ